MTDQHEVPKVEATTREPVAGVHTPLVKMHDVGKHSVQLHVPLYFIDGNHEDHDYLEGLVLRSDPDSPFEFWTTQQYVKGTTEWGTQVSQVFVSPRLTGVTSPAADGTYGIGANVPIEVTFNGPVAVTGRAGRRVTRAGPATIRP